MAKYIEGDLIGKEVELTGWKGHIFYGQSNRKYIVEVGKTYIVQPLNPRKKKHINRQCIVIDFELDKIGVPITFMQS